MRETLGYAFLCTGVTVTRYLRLTSGPAFLLYHILYLKASHPLFCLPHPIDGPSTFLFSFHLLHYPTNHGTLLPFAYNFKLTPTFVAMRTSLRNNCNYTVLYPRHAAPGHPVSENPTPCSNPYLINFNVNLFQ